MPDLVSPNRCSEAFLQRRQSLKNVGGCMSAFSQMFQLNRVLGGSNKFLATPDAQAQTRETKTVSSAIERQSPLRRDQTQEAEMGIDLRHILDAKQEPFVLQDVIWEKRHPLRTKSSRELNFEVNEMSPSSRKSQSSKRAKSKDGRKPADLDHDADMQTQGIECGSSALVKSNQIPAESMVALPSSQASPRVKKSRSSVSKPASTGKSPVKSPNKRALLMEAAAKILEGSNQRASKMPSSSVRSLLSEFDGSKHVQELMRSKEMSLKRASLVVESSHRHKTPSQKVTTSEQKRVESKQHSNSNIDKSFSFVTQSQQISPRHSNDSFQMTDEEVLSIMQSRICPSDGMPAAAREVSQLATTAADNSDAMQHVNHVNNHLSRVNKTRHEFSITPIDVVLEGIEGSNFRPTDEQTHLEAESVPQADRDAIAEKSRDLESATYGDSSNIDLIEQEFVNMSEWKTTQIHSQGGIPNDVDDFSSSGEVAIDGVDCGIDANRSGGCEIRIGDVDVVHAHTLSGLDSDGLVKSYTSTADELGISAEVESQEGKTIENTPTPLLLLCNYSWWAQVGMQVYSPTPVRDEISNDCAGYDSPIAATKGPHAVKVFEGRKEGDNLDEDSSTSPDHNYVDEFQQSSPVSVLDPVYEDSPVHCKPFDYFDDARQKLLESVRRYEMLAHMDLDMLIKMNEESLYHDCVEESDASSFKESLESDAADTCATQHQVLSMGSPDYQLSRYEGGSLNVEAEELCSNGAYNSRYEAVEDDLYIHLDEDTYMQQLQELADEDLRGASEFVMDVRAQAEKDSRRCKALLDFLSEPSDLNAFRGQNRQSQTISSRDTLEEVEKLTGSVIINAILRMDLTESSWGSFHEEVEVMEMELESSLFAALMQELLSDLLF